MPRACGKPGHSSWIRVERVLMAHVLACDNRSTVHLLTDINSTGCGRMPGIASVDKWHVSVDKPPHLGKGGSRGPVFAGFSGIGPAHLSAHWAPGAAPVLRIPSCDSRVLHRPESQSIADVPSGDMWAPRQLAGKDHLTPPPLPPLHISPGPTTTSSINI